MFPTNKKNFMQFFTFTTKANLSWIVYVVLCMFCGEMCTYTYLLRFHYVNSLILWNASEHKLYL